MDSQGQFAVVLQAVRHNTLTDRKTLYVLGVKLAPNKEVALKASEELQKKGYICDVLPVEQLPSAL